MWDTLLLTTNGSTEQPCIGVTIGGQKEEVPEQDDQELLGNLNGPITLMGGDIGFGHKISFKAFEDDINNNKENEIEIEIENKKMNINSGITLMGHFDHEIGDNQKNKISFKNQNNDYEMILFE